MLVRVKMTKSSAASAVEFLEGARRENGKSDADSQNLLLATLWGLLHQQINGDITGGRLQ
jgi:hypothetical protein